MTLEVGKYYLRYDGNVVGPVKPMHPLFCDISDKNIFPFVCGGESYKVNGKHLLSNQAIHPYDLVKEVFVTIPE